MFVKHSESRAFRKRFAKSASATFRHEKMRWGGLGLAVLGLFSWAQPGLAQVTVTTVPRDIDSSNVAGWWRPLVLRGTDTYFAFNAPGTAADNHYVKFGKLTSGGGWTFGFLKNADGTPWIETVNGDDPGHAQPTMAIDGDGFIHVWADGHNNPWQYFRSTSALDVTDIRRSSGMPGTVAFTYPVAATAPNGDVYLMIRNQSGGVRGRGELMAENTSGWIPQALDPTKAVQRISALARNSTTDIVYGAAPTEIDANTGRLYLFEVQ
jgi:hypothetical protein